jgi:hypothetical protein
VTSYRAVFAVTGSSTLAIAPVTWQVRIVRAEITTAVITGSVAFTFTKFIGSSLSGGATVTPIALRDGANPSTATVKSAATASGTSKLIISQPFATAYNTYATASDLVIAPGNTFQIGFGGTGSVSGANNLVIEYEEWHLARSS